MNKCGTNKVGCVQNEKSRKLIVFIEGSHFEANFCPFCGYQPERSKREDINYPKFECKQCHFTAIQHRYSNDKKITCPECGIINDAVL